MEMIDWVNAAALALIAVWMLAFRAAHKDAWAALKREFNALNGRLAKAAATAELNRVEARLKKVERKQDNDRQEAIEADKGFVKHGERIAALEAAAATHGARLDGMDTKMSAIRRDVHVETGQDVNELRPRKPLHPDYDHDSYEGQFVAEIMKRELQAAAYNQPLVIRLDDVIYGMGFDPKVRGKASGEILRARGWKPGRRKGKDGKEQRVWRLKT